MPEPESVPLQDTANGVDVTSAGSELTAEEGGVVSTGESSSEHPTRRHASSMRNSTVRAITALLRIVSGIALGRFYRLMVAYSIGFIPFQHLQTLMGVIE
jgi:hypothetical protein